MNDVLAALMLWISAHSSYETAGLPLPEVVEMTPQQMTAEYYSGVPHLIPDRGVDERVRALYSINEGAAGRIYVLDADLIEGAAEFDHPYENPAFREMLLHELVHHVQHRTGAAKAYLCIAQGEKEAYHLAGVYLDEVNAPDPMPNRAFWGHMYSRC